MFLAAEAYPKNESSDNRYATENSHEYQNKETEKEFLRPNFKEEWQ